MRAIEFLIERATDVLFHYTGIRAGLKILQSGNFELASVTGTKSEEQYAPPGYPYFLSLTRTITGDYHRWVGSGAVMFKLNGDWFNSRYIVKPIDYWERAWLHSNGTRTRESEDRVFSKEPTIPITPVTEVHVLLKEQNEYRSPETRQILITAKQQGLPVFFYTDEAAWRLLDKRKALTPTQGREVLRGPQPAGNSRKPTDYVKPWIELITKNDEAHLSERAKRALKTMRYYGNAHEDQNLSVDLSNARKPDSGDRASAVWIIKYMQDNNFKSTLELKNAISDKWDAIFKAKQAAAQPTEVVAEGRGSGYKEIEFVCANPEFPDATDPELQKQLYASLKQIPGVIPLFQDQSDYSEGQYSLTAIYKDRAVRGQILKLAKQLGVSVDLEQPVTDDYVDRAIRSEHEGQQDVEENFADGKHPEDRGDSKRLGVPTKSSVSNLRKYAKSHSGRAAQLANWAANMKSGKKKAS